ncbi:MAG: hypothetical protein ACK4NF_05525, partial [Planctomycetota bacterium]
MDRKEKKGSFLLIFTGFAIVCLLDLIIWGDEADNSTTSTKNKMEEFLNNIKNSLERIKKFQDVSKKRNKKSERERTRREILKKLMLPYVLQNRHYPVIIWQSPQKSTFIDELTKSSGISKENLRGLNTTISAILQQHNSFLPFKSPLFGQFLDSILQMKTDKTRKGDLSIKNETSNFIAKIFGLDLYNWLEEIEKRMKDFWTTISKLSKDLESKNGFSFCPGVFYVSREGGNMKWQTFLEEAGPPYPLNPFLLTEWGKYISHNFKSLLSVSYTEDNTSRTLYSYTNGQKNLCGEIVNLDRVYGRKLAEQVLKINNAYKKCFRENLNCVAQPIFTIGQSGARRERHRVNPCL